MEIEYEATFIDIDKEKIRKKLKDIGAILKKPEFLQKRVAFSLPGDVNKDFAWIRVRDEQDKITMTYKEVKAGNIENQKEINLTINSFYDGIEFLEKIGCKRKSYQESKRELWIFDGVEITIDEWPFLEPYVEIEGKSESDVKKITEKMGLDYSKALFCCADTLINKKYGVPLDIINNHTPKIRFGMKNPWVK